MILGAVKRGDMSMFMEIIHSSEPTVEIVSQYHGGFRQTRFWKLARPLSNNLTADGLEGCAETW